MSLHPFSQLLSAVLLLLRLWDTGTREMDNERSSQGTSAPLLPLLQRFQNIHSSKEEQSPEEEAEVNICDRTFARIRNLSNKQYFDVCLLACLLLRETCLMHFPLDH